MLESKEYIPMPVHSKVNVNGKYYEIISCRTIKRNLAKELLKNKEFTCGDSDPYREMTASWWYNATENLIMIKGKKDRYYLKRIVQLKNDKLGDAYTVALNNYKIIAAYVAIKQKKNG